MRKLAYFSFSFAAGCLSLLLGGFYRLGWLPAVILLLLSAACFFLRGRRERAIGICALGAACGLLWTGFYHRTVLVPAEAAAGELRSVSVLLSSYPQETDYGWRAQGIAQSEGAQFRTHIYFSDEAEISALKPGDCLSGPGTVSIADDEDDSDYNRSIGVPMQIRFSGELTVQAAEGIPMRFWPAALSHLLRSTAETLFPEDVRGYVVALLTGDKRGLSYQQISDLQVSGVYHALAVSGMHVSILMSLLALMTMKNRRLYPLIGIPVLVFYCVMIGGTASVVRAAVMHGFLMASHLFRRESDTPTALGASLLVLTVQNPWCLLNVGLQLSFLATAGILLFYDRIFSALIRWKPKRLYRFWRGIAAVIACSSAALMLTLPVMAAYFGVISMLCIAANLLVLQPITIAFALSFLSCFGAWTAPWLGAALAYPVTLLLRWVALCCRWIARLPFSAVYPDTLYPVLWLGLFYCVAVFLLLRKKRSTRRELWTCAGVAALTLCISLLLSRLDGQQGSFSFKALDVGQGQCLLYRSEECTAAVDCGGSYGEEAGETLARELLSGGDRRLDHLILTHYDEDHTGGVEQLLYRVRVDTIWMPDVKDDSGVREELEALAASAGTEIRYTAEHTLIPFGGGSIEVFAPLSLEGGNASSLCVLASFDGFDILATGDLPISGELELLKTYELPDLEVLVAGHHGADSSTGPLLLSFLQPEMLVISVGENRYGHPSAAVLDRAEAVEAEIYRTDLNGSVTIRR